MKPNIEQVREALVFYADKIHYCNDIVLDRGDGQKDYSTSILEDTGKRAEQVLTLLDGKVLVDGESIEALKAEVWGWHCCRDKSMSFSYIRSRIPTPEENPADGLTDFQISSVLCVVRRGIPVLKNGYGVEDIVEEYQRYLLREEKNSGTDN